MSEETPLADGWQVRGALGDTWRWLCGPGRPPGEAGWLPARVPGTVLDDVHRAALVPDPRHAENSLAAEWVPQRTWVYRRPLRVARLRPGQRALLRFAGVDHDATVLVDGKEAARHSGMFVPFEVDVTEQLADGAEHLLAVAVHPAPANEPQVGRTDRVRVHKARMDYGWDFCPRMIHQGIWKPVTLETAGLLRLAALSAEGRPEKDGTRGTLHVHAALEAAAAGTLHVTVRPPGTGAEPLHVERRVVAGTTEAVLDVDVPEPQLWWPNGHGGQPLYTVTATLEDTDGNHAGERSVATGFRRLRLVPNPGAPAHALPYTLEVNGRRIHAKGWNWVPQDAWYGVPRPEKLAHLLRLAADAHVTLLRVWGGGLIESEEFYAQCDRLGLLVWQEFSLSSSGIDSVPSDDPDYVALMATEARAIVPTLRHHPSLAVWSPGNELHETAVARPLAEKDSPVIAALADIVAELDPHRAWLPGSPSGVTFLNRADLIEAAPDDQHDVHGPWEHQGLGAHQRLYDAGTALLHSEFGVEGMANRRTWEAVVPPGRAWPTGRDNPLMEHLGAWWNNTPLVQDIFGGRLPDPDVVRRASQFLQYDGLRYAVEANLRRAPRSSGAIPWQFNEPFPNAWCTAAVDHRGDPKPAYHGVRRAYRPDHVCARFATQVWAGRDRFAAQLWSWTQDGAGDATVTARLLTTDGLVLAETTLPAAHPATDLPATTVPAACAGELTAAVPVTDDRLFLLELALLGPGNRLLARNRYLHSTTADLAPLLDVPQSAVEAGWDDDLGAVHLRHTGGPAALGLHLTDSRPIDAPGWAAFDDNMFDLLPGESAHVRVDWRAAPAEGRAIRLEGWNARARELR